MFVSFFEEEVRGSLVGGSKLLIGMLMVMMTMTRVMTMLGGFWFDSIAGGWPRMKGRERQGGCRMACCGICGAQGTDEETDEVLSQPIERRRCVA